MRRSGRTLALVAIFVWASTTVAAQAPGPTSALGVLDVRSTGARCDGRHDDTVAIQTAVNSAQVGGYGVVLFPSGSAACRTTSTIVVPRAVTLACLASPAQNNNSGASCFVDHDFPGVMFLFDGSGPGNPGAGYGVRNVVLRQRFGNAKVTGGAGTAIRIAGTNLNQRGTWIRIENVQIEESAGADPWTVGIDIDGSSMPGGDGVRDVWISDGRILNGATTGSPSGIRILNAQNVFITNVLVNGPGGNVICSGSAAGETNSVFVSQGGGDTFEMDFCRNVSMMGGAWRRITNTVHTAGQNLLLPSRIVTPFTNQAPASTFVAFVDSSGALRLHNNVVLINDQGLQGTKTNGTVADLLRKDRQNRTTLDSSGEGVYVGGLAVQHSSPAGYLMAGAGVPFASLPAPMNGMLVYCTDCAMTNPCVGRGTGAFAKRINGVWVCS